MKLYHKETQQVLVSDLKIANSFLDRLIGLMGKETPEKEYALWLTRCNSIHTGFMKFSLDLILLDKQNTVLSVQYNISPWRFTLPHWGAVSVIEAPSSFKLFSKINVGDSVYVGD